MQTVKNLPWQEALQILKSGNKRFVDNKLHIPDVSCAKRESILLRQQPMAIILSCSDSRVPPNLIFNQGLEDLFVIRIAGNIATTGTVASIEYAVSVLDVNLVVVLGHQQCGAVAAAMQGSDYGENLNYLFQFIRPVFLSGEPASVNEACVLNAKHAAGDIPVRSGTISKHIEGGKLKIIPAYYNLDSGEVSWL